MNGGGIVANGTIALDDMGKQGPAPSCAVACI